MEDIIRIKQRAFEEMILYKYILEDTQDTMNALGITEMESPREYPWNLLGELCYLPDMIEEYGSYSLLSNKKLIEVFLDKWIGATLGKLPCEFDPSNCTKRDRNIYILLQRYHNNKTLVNIGKQVDLSKERVREIIHNLLRKLRWSQKIFVNQYNSRLIPSRTIVTKIIPLFFKQHVDPLNFLAKSIPQEYMPYHKYNGDFSFFCICLLDKKFRDFYFGDIPDYDIHRITAQESHVPGDDPRDEYGFYEETAVVDIEHNAIRIAINHD